MVSIVRSLTIFFLFALAQNTHTFAQSFADRMEFIGPAVREDAYHVWGSSPVIGEDGKIHLFVARWPVSATFDPGWRSHSEIAHYVSDRPEGPFAFSDVVVSGTGEGTWDSYGAHNPAIHRIGDKFYLLYIANSNPKPPYHPASQRTGMLIAESVYGPWKKAGIDGMILAPSKDPSSWTYNSRNGIVNPALLQHPNGKFYLYFKSNNGIKSIMGLAISNKPEGPYIIQDAPVTNNEQSVEDGYAFIFEGDICLLTTDNHGIMGTPGEGILWRSCDGKTFDRKEKGFYLLSRYTTIDKDKVIRYYGPDVLKFERPQLLLIDNKPAYLYAPGGNNIYGGNGTISYVLKFNNKIK